jgi:DNA invertase Pin-like site-specific DNA recombinase
MPPGPVKCVIYAAKSTEDVHGSIGTQIADCAASISATGVRTVSGEFVDEAVSGFSKSRGRGLSEAMTLAQELAALDGAAELWVQHSDRLARGDGKSARHVVEIALWALKAGVVVRPVQDPDTFRDLLYAVIGGQRNHEDSKRKGAASTAGRRRAAERGEYGGALLDGYRVVATVTHRGVVSKRMEIDPERRPLIETIFRLGLAGKVPWRIAKTVNDSGWRTIPSKGHPLAAKFTPTRIRFVLGNPRYAGLATYKAEVVATASWPAYITVEEHKRLLRRRKKRARGPTLNPREPFLLARLATCGECGATIVTLTGHNRADNTPTRRYACHRHHERLCPAPRLDTAFIDGLFVASLTSFLPSLKTVADRDAVSEYPGAGLTLGPAGNAVSEMKRLIRQALEAGDDVRADRLLDELVEFRQNLELADRAPQAVRHAHAGSRAQTPSELLRDFDAWAANECNGRPRDPHAETVRLNRVLRDWFTHVTLTTTPPSMTITAYPRASAWAHLPMPSEPVSVSGSLGAWHVARSIAGHGRPFRRSWTNAEIEYALVAWTREHGQSPRWSDWPHVAADHPCNSTVEKRYGGWANALRAARLTTSRS